MSLYLYIKILFYFAFFTTSLSQGFSKTEGIHRYALIVGKNDGGNARSTLRYAETDAKKVSHIFNTYGGIDSLDQKVLLNPNEVELDNIFLAFSEKFKALKISNKRHEFFFYYSGHSNEDGLLLGKKLYPYKKLKDRISGLSTNVNVVILDSCASGSFTLLKGGKKRPGFMTNNLSNLEGHVYLTSSSNKEAAQESDIIKGSYFTHYLVSGLRGAADNSGDGKVTLNEAYQYAYNETLAKTEKTLTGAQHPSYDIQLSGSGELVMTDTTTNTATLVLPKTLYGRMYIRDINEKLVAEVKKVKNKNVKMGLEPGSYSIILNQDGNLYKTVIVLTEKKSVALSHNSFKSFKGEFTTPRGEKEKTIPAVICLTPNLCASGEPTQYVKTYFGLGIWSTDIAKVHGLSTSVASSKISKELKGIQTAFGYTKNKGNTQGVQTSFGYNETEGNLQGIQTAFGFNKVQGNIQGIQTAFGLNKAKGKVTGVQVAFAKNHAEEINGAQVGIYNVAKKVNGVQIGLVNYTEDINGISLGLISIVKNGIMRMELAVDNDEGRSLTMKYGTRYTYSMVNIGVHKIEKASNDFRKNIGLGFGARLDLQPFYLNIESMYSLYEEVDIKNDEQDGTLGDYDVWQLRVLPGFKVTEKLSIFAGITYNHAPKEKIRVKGENRSDWTGVRLGIEVDF